MPTTKKKKTVKVTKDKVRGREILYPIIDCRICSDDEPLTSPIAKELLGWEEEDEIEFDTDYLLKDYNKVKIQCNNNVINRPLYMSDVMSLKQEILRKKWRLNGETIIIGNTGLILNGQHTLIALVLAGQEWEENEDKWDDWKEQPSIDKIVVFGIEETDETINTMDTCKPRSLGDVIYRSSFFKDKKAKERKAVARVCSYAVNMLWERMGAENAFAPKQTHSEALDFIAKHPRILDAVYHIYVENGDNNIGKYLSPGYAAGMLYLMGCSTTDPLKYVSNPNESSLDWSNWDKACEFFVLIGSGSHEIKQLRLSLAKLIEDEEGSGGTRKERLALLTKAWTQWRTKGKVSDLSLKYVVKDDVRTLMEEPSVGGIDLVSFSSEDIREE